MKKFLKFLPVVALLAGVFGVATTKSDTIGADAAWSSENVTVYLDKGDIGLTYGWWITDATYIDIWDGTTNHRTQMTKLSDEVFSYEITSTMIDSLTTNSVGFKFYVYSDGYNIPQNRTAFVGALDFKTEETDYYTITSANEVADQTISEKNKAVEDTIAAILTLDCESTDLEAQPVVDQYNALRPLGKTNLNTWEVDAGVTWYDRLAFLAANAGATNPSSSSRYSESKQLSSTLQLVTLVGTLSLSALAGFYFLKTKKQ